MSYKNLFSKHLGIFLIFTLILNSCIFSDEIQFNEDFSGSVNLEVDLTNTIKVTEELQGDFEEAEKSKSLEERVDSLNQINAFDQNNQIEGVSNFKVTASDNLMNITFDFEDLEALNRAYKDIEISEMMGFQEADTEKEDTEPNVSFRMESGVFVYYLEKPQYDKEEEAVLDMSEIEEVIQFNTTLSFSKNIDKVKTKNIKVSQSGNTVSFAYNVNELKRTKGNPEIKITFK